MKKINFFILKMRIMLVLTFLMMVLIANAQQVIGTFPNMNGGFEGSTGSITGTASSTTQWWLQLGTNNTVAITSGAGARTGNNYMNAVQTGTASRRIHSPLSESAMASGTTYTVQFYYIGDKDGTPHTTQTMSGGMYNTFTTPETKFQGWLNPSNVSWTKNVFTIGTTFTNTAQIYGIIRLNNGCTFDFDDFVVYAGTEDNTAPGSATDLILTPAPTQIGLSWTAPAGGVDGGGYMVVKYTEDPTGQPDPNVNGIYAVNNTIGSGTVVYIGTNNSFTNTGLTSSRPYYYRVYTIDKAFNYASALTGNTSTTAEGFASEPTAQVTGLNFTGVSSSGMTINFTPAVSGGGTNHLVVIGTSLSGDPADGSSYTANTAYGSGSTVAGGSVVYNGSGNSVAVTGLTYNTTYYVRVYDFNGSAGTENYYTTSPASSSQITSRRTLTSAASGAWATAATWSPAATPTQNDNVVISNGHVITFTGISANSCYNLTINSGGQLYNITGSPNYTIGYMGIYGTTVQVDGTFGDASTEYFTGFQFNQNCTLSGTGTIRINRMRPYATAANAIFTFDADATLTNASGVTMMCELSGSNNIGYKINSGRTVTSLGSFTGGNSSSTNASFGCSLTVDGTLNANSNIYLNAASGHNATLTVNGTLNIKTLNASNSATGGGAVPTITVNGSGIINVTGTGASADFSNIATAANITGTGTFNLDAAATIKVGAADGLNPSTGPVRCSTRTYNSGAYFEFNGTSGTLVTGNELPATIGNLVINSGTTVNLSNAVTVNGTLSLTNGQLNNATNNVTLGNAATITKSAGSLASTPVFGSSVNLNYSTGSSKGNEFPASDIIGSLTLNNGATGISINDNRTFSSLTVSSGSQVTIAPAQKVTVSTTMANNGTINLQSDATGTATLLTPASVTGTGIASVQQYLASGRNWYISSPVTGARALSGFTFYSRDEVNNAWTTMTTGDGTTTGDVLTVGQGYIANLASGSGTITFTGTLNAGNKTITVNRTAGISKAGYNLVGNPFTSYLNMGTIVNNSVNLEKSIWYRTQKKNTTTYHFDTYNTASGFGINNSGNNPDLIGTVPPMQSFWVRVSPGQTSATIDFPNSYRTHADPDTLNPLKIKRSIASVQPVLRLRVSNGENSDETALYSNPSASNDYDLYDSGKMSNNNALIPEIFTLSGTEQLAINGMNQLPFNVELPIGFSTLTAGTFTLKASDISNFEAGSQLILNDKLANQETVLTTESEYSFTSEATTTTSRFSVIIKSPSATTFISKNKLNYANAYCNDLKQIVVFNNFNSGNVSAKIYNLSGNKIHEQILNKSVNVIQNKFNDGIYLVKLENGSNSETLKVVVK